MRAHRQSDCLRPERSTTAHLANSGACICSPLERRGRGGAQPGKVGTLTRRGEGRSGRIMTRNITNLFVPATAWVFSRRWDSTAIEQEHPVPCRPDQGKEQPRKARREAKSGHVGTCPVYLQEPHCPRAMQEPSFLAASPDVPRKRVEMPRTRAVNKSAGLDRPCCQHSPWSGSSRCSAPLENTTHQPHSTLKQKKNALRLNEALPRWESQVWIRDLPREQFRYASREMASSPAVSQG